MKYQKGKIKTEHHILKEFIKFLSKVEKIEGVIRLIPGRISRKQKGSSLKIISISYCTKNGFKIILKKGSTAQELFVITKNNLKEHVLIKIKNIINNIEY